MRQVRLIPAVIVLGLALLVLKGTGLVREAQAQSAGSGTPMQVADASAPATKDFAGGDEDTSSASEVDVLSSLSKRRAELDQRAKNQDMRENVLAATEKRVDGKIAELKQLQAQITALLGQRDSAQEAQVKSLVKTYSAMKPKDAARIFDGLSEDVLIPVAQEMKSDALAPVLAAMNPAAAQKLTVKLASKLALPEKAGTDTTTPAPATAAIVPPPAEQTAAAAPPVEQPAAAPSPAPAPQTTKPAVPKRAHTQQAAASTPSPAPKAAAPQAAPPAQQAAATQVAPPPAQQAAASAPQAAPPQAANPQTASPQAPHA